MSVEKDFTMGFLFDVQRANCVLYLKCKYSLGDATDTLLIVAVTIQESNHLAHPDKSKI